MYGMTDGVIQSVRRRCCRYNVTTLFVEAVADNKQ